jgi:hypothetical protein
VVKQRIAEARLTSSARSKRGPPAAAEAVASG